MKVPEIKINGKVLKGISIALSVGTFIVGELQDTHEKSEMKSEIVKEVLDELSKKA